ncbi:hypothetical protein [Brasilonema bromeliae]|nr:hypothetical protein [Brasilonema bromeliae]
MSQLDVAIAQIYKRCTPTQKKLLARWTNEIKETLLLSQFSQFRNDND